MKMNLYGNKETGFTNVETNRQIRCPVLCIISEKSTLNSHQKYNTVLKLVNVYIKSTRVQVKRVKYATISQQ